MRPFNKTTATLVRPHPFSTLCPTPLGNSPVWRWAQHHGAGRRPPGSGCRETDARGPARSAAAGRARCGHAAPRSAPARSS